MVRYKLYFIEGSQLRQAVPFEAENDENAARYVAQRRFGRPCELWEGSRLVQRFDDGRPDGR
jgi:hypothetical protein